MEHMEMQENKSQGRVKRVMKNMSSMISPAFDVLMDGVEENGRIIRRESELFLGTLLTIIGIFSFNSGKYCDGNTADYLSCTRPATFYYYGWFEIICIIVGVFLVILWFQKSHRARE
jgi:hypothetical protein